MKIKFLQLNLHKSPKVNAEISGWLDSGYNKGKIKNIFPSIKVFMANPSNQDEKIRSCILIKSGKLKPIKMAQFCNKDQVAVLLDNNTVVASIYMPGDSTNPPPSQLTQELITFCELNNKKLIIGSDCNSHNTVWGSSDNNNRGEHLLEYLITTNLVICNVGNEPTFVNAIRREVLDITLSSMDIADSIHD